LDNPCSNKLKNKNKNKTEKNNLKIQKNTKPADSSIGEGETTTVHAGE
jgi:hypothetical protein